MGWFGETLDSIKSIRIRQALSQALTLATAAFKVFQINPEEFLQPTPYPRKQLRRTQPWKLLRWPRSQPEGAAFLGVIERLQQLKCLMQCFRLDCDVSIDYLERVDMYDWE